MSATLTLDALRGLMGSIQQVPPPLRFYPASHMVIGPFEDWSRVRSPSRAKRRRRQGHPQRIRIYHLPDPKLLRTADGAVYGHPDTLAVLKQKLDVQSKDGTRQPQGRPQDKQESPIPPSTKGT